MRPVVLLYALLVFCGCYAVGQTKAEILPAGAINGALSPSSIPDSIAYKLVFLSLKASPSADATRQLRQCIRISAIGLSAQDAAALQSSLSQFDIDMTEVEKQVQAQQLASAAVAAEGAIVERTRAALASAFSSEGAARFESYVLQEKTHMIVVIK